MFNADKFIEDIFSGTGLDFNKNAMLLFRHQAAHNTIYREFLQATGKNPEAITRPEDIPFLPIEFFKTHQIKTGVFSEELIFTSSGTTGIKTSKHFLSSADVYKHSFQSCFQLFLGKPEEYIIAALLPSYTERSSSSLIYMVNALIKASRHTCSGFISLNEKTADVLKSLNAEAGITHRKLLLIGVSFALLQVCESDSLRLNYTVVLETGGMKGRRKEITREELHKQVEAGLQPLAIHSEYGMTELLSQAYTSHGKLSFQTPPWMRVFIRDPNDPFCLFPNLKQGALNVIDLANIESCAFLATSDTGRLLPDNSFEVLGRLDNSDLRGCNLMYYA